MSCPVDLSNTVKPMDQQRRLQEQATIDPDFINKLLHSLKLTSSGGLKVPKEGRIATNVIIRTVECGDIMLRFYPEGCQEKLESGFVDFEVKALDYFSSHRLSVPEPLKFSDGSSIKEERGMKIFAYKLLPGRNLTLKDLNFETVIACSEFLKKYLEISEHYVPTHFPTPDGDLEHILKIYHLQLGAHPELLSEPSLKQMASLLNNGEMLKNLKSTPRGIVQADYFYENILFDPRTKSYSVIDFGDAYFGYLLMDIVIGAMEFSVLEDRSWNLRLFDAFLKPHKDWLVKNKISFELFYFLLQINCLRFAIYTLPLTIGDKEPLSNNPYIFRYNTLQNPSFKSSIKSTYHEVITIQ